MKRIVMILILTFTTDAAYKLEAKVQTIRGIFNGAIFRIEKIIYDTTNRQNRECVLTFGPIISDTGTGMTPGWWQYIYFVASSNPYIRRPIGWTHHAPSRGNFIITASHTSKDIAAQSPQCPLAGVVMRIDRTSIQYEDTVIQLSTREHIESDGCVYIDMGLTLLR